MYNCIVLWCIFSLFLGHAAFAEWLCEMWINKAQDTASGSGM